MAKHFHISIADEAFSFAQNPLSIAAEAALDGIYVIRTNLSAAQSDAAATVLAYKSLSGVEHAFRSLKTVDLELRPVFHWTAPRVRAHVLLCMLAYYLQWHMRQSLASMLFDELDQVSRDAQTTSPVARPSPRRRRAARPPANAPSPQRANHSRCTASTPCSAISPRSPATSSVSGAIASSPSRHPYPHTAPRPRPARRYPHRVGAAGRRSRH